MSAASVGFTPRSSCFRHFPRGPACPSTILFVPATAISVPLTADGEGGGGSGVARHTPSSPPVAGTGPMSSLALMSNPR